MRVRAGVRVRVGVGVRVGVEGGSYCKVPTKFLSLGERKKK